MKKVKYNKLVKELFETVLSSDAEEDKYCKKLVANVNFGLLEKGQHKVQKSKIFNSLEEVRYHQATYGGKVSILKKFHEEVVEQQCDLDFGLDDIKPITTSEWIEDEKKYYILNVSDSATLKNGFRYIKELLLQHHNFKMYSDYKKLTDNGIDVFSVKTDAFTIKSTDLDNAKACIEFNNDIGGWRCSKEENIHLPTDAYKYQFNYEMKITIPTFERVELNDEWDCDAMCDIFEEKKRVMIRANLPGSGKSYACEHMKKRNHNVLFVCPTNKLVQKYGSSGITINKFFSIGISSNANSKMAKFDDTSFDTIVFDEIYMSDMHKLARIKKYCDENPDKVIIATGDTSQLEPINSLSNQFDYDYYSDFCINQIFKYEIYLEENKRLKTDEDKMMLKQIKSDIFDNKIPDMNTINKYFKSTSEITKSLKNIAYMNDTCNDVAKHIRKLQCKNNEYEVGEFLICREYCKVKDITFNVNFEYEIVKIREFTLTIKDVSNSKLFDVPLKSIRNNFIFNYCGTAHSFQGSSIDESISIFDYKRHFCTRKWIWTAITRATELKNVYFYNYVEPELNTKLIMSSFERKIKGYASQDREANREISKDNYINAAWLKSCINKRCSECNNGFYFKFDTGYTESNITADRIDNSQDHNLDNIQPMCRYCNCCKSDKSMSE